MDDRGSERGPAFLLSGDRSRSWICLARRALQLDSDEARLLSVAGHTLAFVVLDLEIAAVVVARALTLNPNLALAWMVSGWVNVWSGRPDVAIDHFVRAMRLSPRDPQLPLMRFGIASAHYLARRYDAAASWVDKATQERQGYPSVRVAAASAALAGRPDEAKALMARLLQLDPSRRVSNLQDVLGPYRPEDPPAEDHQQGRQQRHHRGQRHHDADRQHGSQALGGVQLRDGQRQ